MKFVSRLPCSDRTGAIRSDGQGKGKSFATRATTDLIAKEERNLRGAVWKLRLQLTTGQLQDPQRVRRARKDLARLMTMKRERELDLRGRRPGSERANATADADAQGDEDRRRDVGQDGQVGDSFASTGSSSTSNTSATSSVRRSSWPTTRAMQCKVGDTVEIVESRPLSMRKRWRVRESFVTAWPRTRLPRPGRRADRRKEIRDHDSDAIEVLDVADNSGAKRIACINIAGGSKGKYAGIGDVITASVKEAARAAT